MSSFLTGESSHHLKPKSRALSSALDRKSRPWACKSRLKPEEQTAGLCGNKQASRDPSELLYCTSSIVFYVVAELVETATYVLVLLEIGQTGIYSTTYSRSNNDLQRICSLQHAEAEQICCCVARTPKAKHAAIQSQVNCMIINERPQLETRERPQLETLRKASAGNKRANRAHLAPRMGEAKVVIILCWTSRHVC